MELGKQVTVRLFIPGTDIPIDMEQAQIQWIHDQTFDVRFLEIRQSELDELEQLIDEYIALNEGGQA